MAENLAGKVAIVTGAARGLGKGIALGLADAGADVVLADLGDARKAAAYELSGSAELSAAVDEIAKRGVRALAVTSDVTVAADCERLVAETIATFGRLDILVNNAGVIYTKPLLEFDEAQWDLMFDVNVKGVFLCSRAATPSLLQTAGCIVNISSIAGKAGYPEASGYCATKWAVIGLTESLSAELAPKGVRVNAVCPGVVPTHMMTHHLASEERGGDKRYASMVENLIPLKREQSAKDIADAVVYLATAPNVSGVSLSVSGGV